MPGRTLDGKIRRRILKRDDRRCRKCSRKNGLEVHHIVAVREGGSDVDNNLITLCRRCHRHAPGPDQLMSYISTGVPPFMDFTINTIRRLWMDESSKEMDFEEIEYILISSWHLWRQAIEGEDTENLSRWFTEMNIGEMG